MELGPSLLILFLFILFPMMDLIVMLMQYCAGWYLNNQAAHEAACVRRSQWQMALDTQANAFCRTGVGAFLRMQPAAIGTANGIQQTASDVIDPNTGQPPNPPGVKVVTTVPIQPMIIVPLPGMTIPGLTAPMIYTFQTERQREDLRP
jgi:hypothetical protein